MSLIARVGAAAVAATLSTFAAAAVERAGVPDDYRLSMQMIENCMKSQTRIIERAAREPKLKAELEADQPVTSEQMNVEHLTKQLESTMPNVSALMKQYGCSARDYATMMLATMQAAAVASLTDGGREAPAELSFVPKENVEFLRKNEPRLRALSDEVSTAREKAGIKD
ncbi:MAG TPA: hypothetical protein VM491_21360 [Burkholderiaceae bacterium]|nr:hypothetical protein [Burkholderiaceae bacterium]